jgi:A/G-specific adenine glycosylase
MEKKPSSSEISEFKGIISSYFEEKGRSFPWRTDTRPWGVLVSEFMLQQTQTEQVIPYWERWMRLWPAPEDLNKVSLEDALREWSGLGYNHRGRYVKDCARIITKKYGGKVPETPAELLSLPGIGAYTAGAVACFAYNHPGVFIETNIRASVLHFFFQGQNGVKDREIYPILEEALDRENPRRWYWALMDYGAALKRLTRNPGRRSARYSRQSSFKGSFRQIRGGLVKALVSRGPASAEELLEHTGFEREDLYRALAVLEKETMIAETGGIYRISEEPRPPG